MQDYKLFVTLLCSQCKHFINYFGYGKNTRLVRGKSRCRRDHLSVALLMVYGFYRLRSATEASNPRGLLALLLKDFGDSHDQIKNDGE